MSTRLLSIECPRNDSNEVRERLYRKILFISTELKFGNTRNFHFLPFSATPTLTNDTIRKGVILQQKFLLAIIDIQIKYINNTEWILPGTDISFRQYVLQAKSANNTASIFINLEIAGKARQSTPNHDQAKPKTR